MKDQSYKTVQRRRLWGVGLITVGLLIGVWSLTRFMSGPVEPESDDPNFATIQMRKRISEALGPHLAQTQFPTELDLPDHDGETEKVAVDYSIRQDLQQKSEQILRAYKPDYGAVVMMEADTGRVLVLTQFFKDNEDPRLRPFFSHPLPAASVFKIVTAAAAVDRYQMGPESILNFMGGHYTLYRRNVVGPQNPRWAQRVTLREAFARSYNTAFGRLAIENMQPHDLLEYASRFGFHRKIPSELKIPIAITEIPDKENMFNLAEMASGFNKVTQITAIQGAMIAGAVANQGMLVAPTVIDRLKSVKDDEILFENNTLPVSQVFSESSAESLKQMMHATLEIGTSRRSFQPFRKRRLLQSLEMGGKTGSLTAHDPRGKLDWFVGYVQDPSQKPISIAVVTVHGKYWTVKSATVAQQLFAHFLALEDHPAFKSNRSKRKAAGRR